MAKLFNRVGMTVSGTPGTGTITLLAAISAAYCTFAESGVANTNVVSYFIDDGTNFECGIGTYTSSGTTLSRDTVTLSKIAGVAGTTKVTLTSAALVYLSPRKEDIGPVLQCLQTTYTANTNLTTVIPFDDTVPTSSEGTQVLSLAITPQVSTNKILCSFSICGSGDGSVFFIIASLFRGTTCIGVVAQQVAGADAPLTLTFEFLDSPASASAQTYSVRVGPEAGTVRLNGITTARRFGGAASCTLTLSEVAA